MPTISANCFTATFKKSSARVMRRAAEQRLRASIPKTACCMRHPAYSSAPKPSTSLLAISARPIRTSFTPPRRGPDPPQCRAAGVKIGAARRAAQLYRLGCGHRPRWKDRGALCVPRSRTVVEGDLFAGAACGAVKPRLSSRPLWGKTSRPPRGIDGAVVRFECGNLLAVSLDVRARFGIRRRQAPASIVNCRAGQGRRRVAQLRDRVSSR